MKQKIDLAAMRPHGSQTSAEQVYLTLNRNLQMLAEDVSAINRNANTLMIKLQVIQNLLMAKGLITEASMEAEWNAEVARIRESMKSAIVTPDGRPVQSTPITTPETTPAKLETAVAEGVAKEVTLTAPEPGHV